LNVHKTFKNTILKKKTELKIRGYIDGFINSKDIYNKVGKAYKMGFMFYGLPGTGKTSLVHAISNHYKKNVYYANEDLIIDDFPVKMLNDIKPGSLPVFDDIDLMIENFITKRNFKDAKKETTNNVVQEKSDNPVQVQCIKKEINNVVEVKSKKENKDTIKTAIVKSYRNKMLRKFLTVLDGYFFLNGVIVIFATNANTDDFDEALIRPGRIDHKINFGYCDKVQIEKMYKLFGKDFKTYKHTDHKQVSSDVILDLLNKKK
jgi:chaperone BCS1